MRRGMFSGSVLKVLTLVAMAVGHLGYVVFRFLPCGNEPLFMAGGVVVTPTLLCCSLFRTIGAPLVFFLVAEGLRHTRSRERYLSRLLFLAVVGEVPYRLAFYGALSCGESSTALLLFLAALFITAYESPCHVLFRMAVCLWCVCAVAILNPNSGFFGMGIIVAFYLAGRRPVLAAPMLVMGSYPVFTLLSLVPVSLYDGTRGFIRSGSAKWFFYVFYPAHLLLFYGLRVWLLRV